MVATAACCAAVLISTPIDISSAGQSILTTRVATRGPLSLDMSTPASALMSWFKAVQASDVPAVLRLTTTRAQLRVGRKALGAAVDVVGGALGPPSIVQVEAGARRARVRLLVLGYAAGDPQPVSEVPLLVALVRGPGGWQVDDVSYLMRSARAMRSVAHTGG